MIKLRKLTRMRKLNLYLKFMFMFIAIFSAMSVSQAVIAKDETLFQLDGNDYQASDFSLLFQQSLYDIELKYYKDRVNLVDRALLELELKNTIETSGKSEREVAIELFDVAEPTDDEAKAFYEKNKANIDQPFDEVKDRIIAFIREEAQSNKQRALLESIKHDNILTLNFSLPIPPLVDIATEAYPSKGADNAKAVLVEFADFQCPHCKQASSALTTVLAKFKDDLKIIYMDFPVNPSGISRKVAEGAACAGQQDKFWEYHDLAFAQQSELTADSVLALAEAAQLDSSAFRACLASDFPAQHVEKAEAEGLRLGVDSTPTLFLNGRRLHLHNMEEELPAEIEKILADADSAS